ncbi:hypothetical protein IM700_003820 [Paenibacillus sp. DXFW5]|uniref:LSM domain-containing protein n=1 Tax=Paenibacillus rhizolycopersici TaxID=2780073 RepID=A0ABS2H0G3_9BACL|nr:hypothetical protein [Paenibacillus rhizolycopersici]MBM6994790.1 hypothetical protein [Paenibacillus rhizolycopersici]
MASSANIRNRAKQLKGQPVRVLLHDGRSYIGWIAGLDSSGLLLSVPPRGKKKSKKKAAARSKKARVSAFQPLFGGGIPGYPGSSAGIRPPVAGWGFGGGPGLGYGSFSGNPGRPGAYGFAGGPGPGRPGFTGFGGPSGGSGGSEGQAPEGESPERPRRAGIFGMVQKVQKYMPLMKMGYNAIKSIIPLFNGIKALMV